MNYYGGHFLSLFLGWFKLSNMKKKINVNEGVSNDHRSIYFVSCEWYHSEFIVTLYWYERPIQI
jgi:hypothetical protein